MKRLGFNKLNEFKSKVGNGYLITGNPIDPKVETKEKSLKFLTK